MRRFTTNPLAHLKLAKQKPDKSVHSESDNKSEHAGMRNETMTNLESPER